MFIRGKTLVRKGPHVAALAFVLVLVASLSSAGAATYPVAQPGVSVFKYPNHTWDPSSLPRYATEVVTAPSLLAGIKTASPTTKVLNYKEAMALADNCGYAVDTCQTAITCVQIRIETVSASTMNAICMKMMTRRLSTRSAITPA